MRYRTREGDMLDQICLEYYGRMDVVVEVLAANPTLADQPPVLPAGLVIELPVIVTEQEETRLRLWD